MTLLIKRVDLWKRSIQGYQVGQVVTGTIVEYRVYGVLVKLETDAVGLLHKDEIDWTKINPLEFMNLGDEIEVKILSIDEERQRIALSRRELLDDPRVMFIETAEVGNVYEGKVAKVVDYGMFVEISRGVRGLLHIDELGFQKDQNRTAFDAGLQPGDDLRVRLIKIEQDRRRLTLALA